MATFDTSLQFPNSAFCRDDLAAGHQVTPFALAVPKGKDWHLVYRAARCNERGFVIFRDWLVRAARRAEYEVRRDASDPVTLISAADQG